MKLKSTGTNRNKTCHCGSGLKFKRCCYGWEARDRALHRALQREEREKQAAAREQERSAHRRKVGLVARNPIFAAVLTALATMPTEGTTKRGPYD